MLASRYLPLAILILTCLPQKAAATSPEKSVQDLPAYFTTGLLDIDARRWAQVEIERVYDSRRLWPSSNPGAKPPFTEAVPAAVINARVGRYLRLAALLDRRWQESVSPEALRAERLRIERNSRAPDILNDLYSALRHDDRLIAECLVFPALIERLTIAHYAEATDADHALEFQAWLENLQGQSGLDAAAAIRIANRRAAPPSLGGTSKPEQPAAAQCDQWIVRPGLLRFDPRSRPSAVWTGSEAIFWGGTYNQSLNSGVRYNPATDAWSVTAAGVSAPPRRNNHSAVWTGSRMIIWGGIASPNGLSADGGLYDPASDSWTYLPVSAGTPSVRSFHGALWTGTEMIIWGGTGASSTFLNTGARYNPLTGLWSPVSTTLAPAGRSSFSLVWTGTEMIIWGGSTSSTIRTNTGGRYDPATNNWVLTPIDANTPSARRNHSAVWTGDRMIVWGGQDASYFNGGALYSPGTNSWTPLPVDANTPSARGGHSAVWTGTKMVIWGGTAGSTTFFNTGGRFDPAAGAWQTNTTTAAPAARSLHGTVWTGSEMIIWGGTAGSGVYLNGGGRYDPAADQWVAIAPAASAIPDSRIYHSGVWTGAEMIVWGGVLTTGFSTNTGGRYNPALDSWLPTSLGANVPPAATLPYAVWTGSRMVVSYGTMGGQYNPVNDSWSTISAPPAGYNPALGSSLVWDGRRMILWGGFTITTCTPICVYTYYNTGGLYDPVNDSWQLTAVDVNTPSPRASTGTVWSGREMVVVGGGTDTAEYNDGARFDPELNRWNPLASPGGVLSPRVLPGAAWTGTRMLIWGGTNNPGSIAYNDGAAYDPTLNQWTALPSAPGAASGRYLMSALWTGRDLLLWGGRNVAAILGDGLRLNPVDGSWTYLPAAIAIDPRLRHASVWTGRDMIVWGGTNDPNNLMLGDGGEFEPGYPASPANSLRGQSASGAAHWWWSAAVGADDYRVLSCTALPCQPATLLATPAVPDYTDSITVGSAFYLIEAENSCGSIP